MMNILNNYIESKLQDEGADIVGFGDLTALPSEVRKKFPVGISVAVKYPTEVIRGISDFPTSEYNKWYINLNERLDNLVTIGAEILRKKGYNSVAMTRSEVGSGESEDNTVLPHKTVATRAGLGWIGKSALLITEKYGAMIRLSSILTNAPLETANPISVSKCGDCLACAKACPAGAISGKNWEIGLYRDEFFDPLKCRKTARERAEQGFGGGNTICGKCIEICPYTRRAWQYR
ncbi:MAG: 4Fe-4S binding protein [Eubacterium sp.]|jgi:epoxyqueuosine reductase QueG|nr:4Fe-4S binding protein [Eubacterium sp.]